MGWGQSNTAELTEGTKPACQFCPGTERERKTSSHKMQALKLFQEDAH